LADEKRGEAILHIQKQTMFLCVFSILVRIVFYLKALKNTNLIFFQVKYFKRNSKFKNKGVEVAKFKIWCGFENDRICNEKDGAA
jgi:hypothetical protein